MKRTTVKLNNLTLKSTQNLKIKSELIKPLSHNLKLWMQIKDPPHLHQIQLELLLQLEQVKTENLSSRVL